MDSIAHMLKLAHIFFPAYKCAFLKFSLNLILGEFVAEVQAALDFIQEQHMHFIEPKTFILVSSVMTWNKSKPLDIDDPEIPFTEDDYRNVWDWHKLL